MSDQLEGPLVHVTRGSTFPWREPDQLETECGRLAADVPAIGRDEMVRKIRNLGIQRASLSSCYTCMETARRHRSWDQDPVDTMRREVVGRRHDAELRSELLAIEALIEAHPAEFRAYLNGLAQTVNLAQRRKTKKQRRSGGTIIPLA